MSLPKFTSVEELQRQINKYFESCDEDNEPITITGLALALDTTRDLLCDYEKKDKYSDAIKKAKLRVHNAYEKRLVRRGNAGDIFALKNFGWKDKQEVDNMSSDGSMVVVVNKALKKSDND